MTIKCNLNREKMAHIAEVLGYDVDSLNFFLNDYSNRSQFKLENSLDPMNLFTQIELDDLQHDSSVFSLCNYDKLKQYKGYLNELTVLHIFVVSKNCNYNCIYCQAGELDQKDNYLMDEDTAKKAVDIALQAPSKFLTFEFQGGEPLTNFKIIKYIVEYSKKKNKDLDTPKEIEYSLVSNLSLLDNEMIEFIVKNDISICTSIDGNEKIHNENRPFKGGNSYKATVTNLKKLQELKVRTNALLTTTKYSLDKYKEIVDEYVKLGLHSISLRQLTILRKSR